MSAEHQARPEPVASTSAQQDNSLPQPKMLESPEVDEATTLQQTTEGEAHPHDNEMNIPPHQRAPEKVTSAAPKADELLGQRPADAEASRRRKEKTILRQTSSGLVVVDGEDNVNVQQDTNGGQNSSSQREDREVLQKVAHEPAPSSTADWQTYAEPSSGFRVGAIHLLYRLS